MWLTRSEIFTSLSDSSIYFKTIAMHLLMLMLMNLFQARAIDQGLKSMSIRQYVSEYVTDFPELLDLVAADDTAMQLGGVGATQPRTLFPLHLPMNEVMEGLKTRRFLKGTIRCERDSIFDCYVVVHSSDGVTRKSVQIRGRGRWQVFAHVILPLTLPGVVTGAFLTFVLCIGDYITPQILGGNNELTLPQLIMLQLGRSGNFPLASALSVVLMAVVTLAYAACARWLRMERL